MSELVRPEAIDSRLVFRIYAAVAPAWHRHVSVAAAAGAASGFAGMGGPDPVAAVVTTLGHDASPLGAVPDDPEGAPPRADGTRARST